MTRFQNGESKAFEALYRKYKMPIFAFLYRQCPTREAAVDLTQDVFARVIRGASSFRHGSRFSTWIYSIARNLAVDAARKRRHRNHLSLDQSLSGDGPSLGDKIPDAGPGPDRSSTGKQLKDDLAKAISKLPDEQREVFVLREYNGLSFKEIAQITDAKEGTIKSRMRYALESLRSELTDYTDYARTLP